MKEKEELIPDDKKYKLMDNGTLMIQNTDESDGGFYECLAKNPEGEVRSRPARMVINSIQSEEQGFYGLLLLVKNIQFLTFNYKYL